MTAFTKTPPSLADAPWLNEPRLQDVMRCITQAGGEVRVAGGAVRNALFNVVISDVDLATTLLPGDVVRVCKAAGFGVHPTGLEHGTITVVNRHQAFQITTLRKDMETDGRHAVVAFTDDWQADALRRDFTMNALYCNSNGKIFDFTDGYTDILRHKIKFVGDPSARIKEDYLRILRFFRFHARFGRGAPDTAGLEACATLRLGLKQISAERLRQELLKLLVAPRAVATLKTMAASGILKLIVPHTEKWRVVGRLPEDGILRLFVMAKTPDDLKESLRLSNDEAERIATLKAAPGVSLHLNAAAQRALLYRLGMAQWTDVVDLAWARSQAKLDNGQWKVLRDLPQRWPLPKFPISGKDLAKAGHLPGPELGAMLRRLEDFWVNADFAPTRDELLQRTRHGL